MKRLTAIAVLITVVIAVLSVSVASAQAGPSVRYVINLRGSSIPADIAQRIQNAGGTLARTLPEVGIVVAVSSDPNFASNMSGVSGVQSVGEVGMWSVPDSMVIDASGAVGPAVPAAGPTPADDLYGLQWGLRRVHADSAWAADVTGSHGTVVAVIDTGVATNHPDMAPNLVFSACFASVPCTPYPSLSFHGTHVAGIVAAAFGGGRVVGVGPNLGIASYNVFEVIPGCGVCAFSDSRWAAQIDAANRGFDVINMSLGALTLVRGGGEIGPFFGAEARIANYVNQRGTVMVASAGNSAVNLNGPATNFPGGIPAIINVGATGIRPAAAYPQPGAFDVLAFYSNYGADVDIVAPGGDCGDLVCGSPGFQFWLVLSSFVSPTPACAATQSCPVGYAFAGGTSMAAPHVAGVAALIMDENPHLRPNQVEARLRQAAEDIGSRQIFGHGMVNALGAVD